MNVQLLLPLLVMVAVVLGQPTPNPPPPPELTLTETITLSPTKELVITRTATFSDSHRHTHTPTTTLSLWGTMSSTLTGEATSTVTITASDGSESFTDTLVDSDTHTGTFSDTISLDQTESSSANVTDTSTQTISDSLVGSATNTITHSISRSASATTVEPTLIVAPTMIHGDAIEFDHDISERTINVVAVGSPFDFNIAKDTGTFDPFVKFRVLDSENGDGMGSHLEDILALEGKTAIFSNRRDNSIDIVFKHDPRFHIRYDEKIEVEFSKECFATKHVGANASIDIIASNRQVRAEHVAVAAARIVAYPVSLVSGAIRLRGNTVLTTSRVDALFRLEPCNFKMGGPLEIYYHPFTIPIGPDRSKYYAGASIMNTVLVVTVLLVHLSIAQLWLERHTHNTFRQAVAFLFFPALPSILMFFLMQHTLEASLIVAMHGSNETHRAVCGAIFCCWILGVGSLVTYVHKTFGALFSAFPSIHVLGTPRSKFELFFRGQGSWGDDDFFRKGNEGFCRMFGSLFYPYRAQRQGFMVVELLLSVVYACLGAAQPEKNKCGVLFIGLLVVESVFLVVLLIARPMNAPIDTYFSILVCGLSITVSALMASHAVTSDTATLTTASWMIFGLETLVAIRVLLDVVVLFRTLAATAKEFIVERRQKQEDEALKKFLSQGQSANKEKVTLATLLAPEIAKDSDASEDDVVVRYRHPRKKQRSGRWRKESSMASVDDERLMNPLGPRQVPRDGVYVDDSDNSEFVEMRVARQASKARRQQWPRRGSHNSQYAPPRRSQYNSRPHRYSPSNSDTYDSHDDSVSFDDSYYTSYGSGESPSTYSTRYSSRYSGSSRY